jgi:hypothetical protein
MNILPLFDFNKRFDTEYNNSISKANSSSNINVDTVESVKDNILNIKYTNTGMILNQNFSMVNLVFKTLIHSEYFRMRITRELSQEEHISFEKLLVIDYASLVLKTVKVFNDFIKHNGIKEGTSRYKEQANVCILRLEGVENPKINFAIGKDICWPTKFHYLRILLDNLNNPKFASRRIVDQFIRTILGVNRIPEDYKAINLETITVKNHISKRVIQEFEDYVCFRIKHPKFGFSKASTPEFCKFGVRPSAKTAAFGPNGLLKLSSASYEAGILMVNDLGKHFKELCKATGNIPFYEYVERIGTKYNSSYNNYISNLSKIPKSERPIDIISRSTPEGKRKIKLQKNKTKRFIRKVLTNSIGKIKTDSVLNSESVRTSLKEIPLNKVKSYSFLSDPLKGSLRTITAVPDVGNKSRTIAICDVWTQLLLTSFEEKLIEFQDKMFGQCSDFHNHQKGFRKFQNKIKPGIKSYDLTAWTDYLPAVLQKIVVKHVFNESIAESWYELVVKCSWNSKEHDLPIKYGTGQGMGTKGSFIIASITDHFITELLLNKCYPDIVSTTRIEDLYSRVGDDLWIWDPDDLISKHLINDYKMSINMVKSKNSNTNNVCGEFVSMNLNYGCNVSRISIRNILDTRQSLFDIIPLILHLEERTEIIIDELLENLWSENLYPKKTWSDLYKGLSLELIVGENKPYKVKLQNSLYRLNLKYNFSQRGVNPYEEINFHKNSSHIKLLIKLYSLNKDSREIKSQILKIREIPNDLSAHWTNSTVKVNRDSTIWDTELQLHELITWCQYVDSTDLLDTIDPDMLMYRILESPDVDTANNLANHYRDSLIGARSDLTFNNVDRLSPVSVGRKKSIQFIKISNHVIIDNISGVPTLKIIDQAMLIDEFLDSKLSNEIRILSESLFVGEDTSSNNGLKLINTEEPVTH